LLNRTQPIDCRRNAVAHCTVPREGVGKGSAGRIIGRSEREGHDGCALALPARRGWKRKPARGWNLSGTRIRNRRPTVDGGPGRFQSNYASRIQTMERGGGGVHRGRGCPGSGGGS